MIVRVTAPNRIDLAGGTTDIYPLYLFMGGGFTVNAAIRVQSRVTVHDSVEGSIRIVSEDLGEKVEARTANDLPDSGPLRLLCRIVKHFAPSPPLEVVTRNDAPAGSGLGASSALAVAVVRALHDWNRAAGDLEEIVDLASDIETSVIGVPTGKQDYLAAAYGGISAIDFGYRGHKRQSIPCIDEAIAYLESSVVLSYTGTARFSGMNNWDVVKAYIDGNERVRRNLTALAETARRVGEALSEGRFDALAGFTEEEWNLRKDLAPGVSSPQIEFIMEKAREAGALSSKICGAGGGGCMISLCSSDRKPYVENAVTAAGGKVLPFAIDRAGVVSE